MQKLVWSHEARSTALTIFNTDNVELNRQFKGLHSTENVTGTSPVPHSTNIEIWSDETCEEKSYYTSDQRAPGLNFCAGWDDGHKGKVIIEIFSVIKFKK